MTTPDPSKTKSDMPETTTGPDASPDRPFALKPGFFSAFYGIATMMAYERISFSKLFSLGIRALIIPALLHIILISPIAKLNPDSRQDTLFNQKFVEEDYRVDKEESGFEQFMQTDGEPSDLDLFIDKASKLNDEYDHGLSEEDKGKGIAFFFITTRAYLLVGIPLICVVFAGGLSRDEIRNDTLPYFLCRPVTRMRYITIRLVAQIIWLEVILLIETCLIWWVGSHNGVPWIQNMFPNFLMAQVFAIPFFCALGIFMGLVNKNYLVFAVIYGAVVEIGIASLPTNIKAIAMTIHMKALVAQSDIGIALAHNWASLQSVWASLLPLLIGTAFFTILTAVLFHIKELLPSREVEN